MDWQTPQLIACIILNLWFGRSVLALEAANPYSTVSTSTPSAIHLDGASTALPVSQTTFSNEVLGRSAATASAAGSTSVNLTAAALSQAAAAASSQALAEVSSSTDAGSKVTVLAQVIIAIGVIPVQLVIITIVLGIHRLVHRRSPRPPQTRFESATSAEESLPYLQPKAELEDEQTRRNELHGEHLVHELDGEDEIFQITDETDSLVLPLQGRQGIHEMPEPHDLGWELPLQGRNEVMGHEFAQELECPIQELESSMQARDKSTAGGNPQDHADPDDDPVTDTTRSSPIQSHFMLRQQQLADINASVARDQEDASSM